jgi:hypothetical protein
MGLTFPDGRRANWPFTGTREEFEKRHGWFFGLDRKEKTDDYIQRCWISNDIAIWMSFDDERKVTSAWSSEVNCPNVSTIFVPK